MTQFWWTHLQTFVNMMGFPIKYKFMDATPPFKNIFFNLAPFTQNIQDMLVLVPASESKQL